MTLDPLIDRLAEHRTLGRAPRAELAWLAAHGTPVHLKAGEFVSTKDRLVAAMYIVLSGRIALIVDRGAGPHMQVEWRGGDVAGLLPYSRLTLPPGDAVVQESADVLTIDRDGLRDMILACYHVTTLLVHTMLDRARTFTSTELHDEKLISVGRLSAGLAHELNNPVAAIERSATLLEERLDEAQRTSRAIGAAQLSDAQLDAADRFRAACFAAAVHGVRSPIEQAAREEAIADWLDDHGVDASVADALAETEVTIDALDTVARSIRGPALTTVMQWAGAGSSVHRLASEVQEAAMRISGLVTAIKGFTHMDQAPVAEPVDVLQGLTNTIAVLQSKARKKSVAIAVHHDPGLPRVRGFAGELNQIWANLLDNALDAVPDGGRIEVTAARDGGRITIKFIDNGSGIAPAILDRIFDPFFTTKPVGQGTGLGLDIVRRLIVHNKGAIAVTSEPGRTEFCVALPAVDAETGANA